MLTKSTDWQSVEKARKQGNFASGKICRRRRLDLTIPQGSANPPQGSKLASKGAYMDVSDRRMQVQLTPEAKIASDFLFIRAIFAVVGFVSALTPRVFTGAGRQTVDKPQSTVNFFEKPEKTKRKRQPSRRI